MRVGLVFLFACLLGLASRQASAACGLMPAGATQSVRLPGAQRAMLVHLPAGFDARRSAPLVFLFHGSGGDGARILKQSGLAATADRHGFILAVPDGGIRFGNGFVWNIPGVPNATGALPGPGDADDVAFVLAAVTALAAERCIDPTRVYATGYSGGGRMASLLACLAADRFAAIAPVVGLRAGKPDAADTSRADPADCRPSRPMPILSVSGDKDTENPIAGGGSGYWLYSLDAAEARWAALDGCAATPITRQVSETVSEKHFARCRDGVEIVSRLVAGGEHVWLADNEAMWAFLSRWRRLR
jgi:polyhydroxybutyrate depolymerase